MTKQKKASKKKLGGKTKKAQGVKGAGALALEVLQELDEMIEELDSKHESVQPLLRKMAHDAAVSNDELEALDDGDSRLTAVIPILRAINDGAVTDDTVTAINDLDSFGAPLIPILLALAGKSV